MSSHRRRNLHTCVNHSQSVARAKCANCGAWICSRCGVMRGGRFYCAVACRASRPPAAPAALPASDTPGSRQKEASAQPPASKTARNVRAVIWGVAGALLIGIAAWCATELFTLNATVYDQHRQLFDLSEKLAATTGQMDILRAELQHFKEEVFAQQKPGSGTARKQPSFTDTWVPPPPLPGTGGSFDNGPLDKKLISLTFDAASQSNAAYAILDTLATRHVKATMFVTGQFAKKNPELIRRILGDGHEIGNHTMSHPHLTMWEKSRSNATLPDITQTLLERELTKANETFRQVAGRDFAPLWRAPYGEKNSQLCAWGKAAGYLHVGWRQGRSWFEGLDSNDWIPNEETPGYHTPEEVYEKIMALAKSEPYGINGGIILMHLGTDRPNDKTQVHYILGKLIDDLQGLGYEIVPVSAMIAAAGIELAPLHTASTDATVP